MENRNPLEFTGQNLVALMRKDCRRQAEAAETKLCEVIDCLCDENHTWARSERSSASTMTWRASRCFSRTWRDSAPTKSRTQVRDATACGRKPM